MFALVASTSTNNFAAHLHPYCSCGIAKGAEKRGETGTFDLDLTAEVANTPYIDRDILRTVPVKRRRGENVMTQCLERRKIHQIQR